MSRVSRRWALLVSPMPALPHYESCMQSSSRHLSCMRIYLKQSVADLLSSTEREKPVTSSLVCHRYYAMASPSSHDSTTIITCSVIYLSRYPDARTSQPNLGRMSSSATASQPINSLVAQRLAICTRAQHANTWEG